MNTNIENTDIDRILDEIYDVIAPNPEELVFGDPTFAQELGMAFQEAKAAIEQKLNEARIDEGHIIGERLGVNDLDLDAGGDGPSTWTILKVLDRRKSELQAIKENL